MNLPHIRARRRQLLEQWTEGVGIIPTNPVQRRNADSDFRFRCDSDFYYLSGFDEPEAILVLCPGRTEGEVVLFLRPKDAEREVWEGRRLGVEAAPETLGVDQAFPFAEFCQRLPELLAGRRELHYRLGVHQDLDRLLIESLHQLRLKPKQRNPAPERICDPGLAIHELRLFKDEDELAKMRQAAEITARGHAAALRQVAGGGMEFEVQAALEGTFRRLGANGCAYESIVASGANATILHYISNDAAMHKDDLLLIDAGAEYAYYAADLTRTYPIGGRFNAAQRQVYELVLAAQKAAFAEVRPGRPFDAYHHAALSTIIDGLRDWGWLSGSKQEILESCSYQRFFMHKSGHWLGLDVHDAGGSFLDGSTYRPLEPGMVLTVEPGLYIAADDSGVPEEFRGIGVRIEDDLLLTSAGHEVLTPQVPKEVAALEQWIAEARAEA